MEAHEQVGAGACNNEKKEEAPSLAASSSPTHSSAEDYFSDTMELADYLHRRVQEIGKQLRHRPFRINTSEKLELAPEIMQGPSRAASEPELASATARACEPEGLPIARENAEFCLRQRGGVPSLAEIKPSSASCLSKRDWSTCAELKHDERPLAKEMKTYHLYDGRPSDGKACNTAESEWEHRAKIFPFSSEFSSENAGNSARKRREDAPLTHIEESVSETAQLSMCGKQQAHNQGLGMGSTSPKHANLAGFQEAMNLNKRLDAGSCPALRHPEGKNMQSQCSTPSHDSSEHLLYHDSSATNISLTHLPPALKLEDAGGFLRSIHTDIVHLQEPAENSSSPQLNVRHSISSVDSSECDNCGNDGDKRGDTLSRVSNEDDGNKSEEIDATSEAMNLHTCRKQEEDVTLVGGDASGRAKPENDALDLLLDAIQVTSEEGVPAKVGPDPYQKGACISERLEHGSTQNMLNGDSLELPSDTPSSHVRKFPIVKKRSDRLAKNLASRKELSGSSVSAVLRFRSLQAVSEVDLPNNRIGGEKLAAGKLADQKIERLKILDRSEDCLQGKRERTWESQQDTSAEEDHISKQENREVIIDEDDACKDARKEQLPTMPAFEGNKQEHQILSRRARLQVLPTKFSDSVLQPWKKGDRRRS